MKALRTVPVALTARAALLALLTLIASGLLGAQQASAQGTVNFAIDPQTTGNSADTLGMVESCVSLNIGPMMFDGVTDYIIDIVVWGDTQAPFSYDVSLNYDHTHLNVLDAGTDPLIKLPGATDLTADEHPGDGRKSTDGQLDASALYVVGGPGTPGDGAILRIALDLEAVDSANVMLTLSAPPLTAYASGAGTHPITIDRVYLAINDTCGDPPIDLSVDSEVTSAPTDLVVGQDGTLSVSTTGTHTNAPFPYTIEATISHTVTAPADCTVNGGTSASDSWTGLLDGGASHVLPTDFTIHCSEPGYHQFVVYNQIQLMTPYCFDPDLSNNTDIENVSVNAWPFGDDDYDGFTTTVEEYVGTDPLDACPDDPSDDAWPLDINMDTFVTTVGDVLPYANNVGKDVATYPELQRLDLNADGFITTVGDVLEYSGMIGESCTNP